MNKISKLVSFEKLLPELRAKLIEEYPMGFNDAVMRIDAPKPFYAILLEDEGVTYLVKLNEDQIKTSAIEYDDDDDDSDDNSSESIEDMDDNEEGDEEDED